MGQERPLPLVSKLRFLRHAVIEDLKLLRLNRQHNVPSGRKSSRILQFKRTSTLIVPDDCGTGQQKRPGEREQENSQITSTFSSIVRELVLDRRG